MSKHETEEQETNEGALSKIDGPTALKYAKWGLMGLGGLVVIKIVAGVLLSPIGLIAAVGAGGFAWWKWGRSPKERVITPPPPEATVAPVASPPPASPPPSASRPPSGPEAAPSRASDEPPARRPAPSRPTPVLPDFARDELAEFDRQLAALDDD